MASMSCRSGQDECQQEQKRRDLAKLHEHSSRAQIAFTFLFADAGCMSGDSTIGATTLLVTVESYA